MLVANNIIVLVVVFIITIREQSKITGNSKITKAIMPLASEFQKAPRALLSSKTKEYIP